VRSRAELECRLAVVTAGVKADEQRVSQLKAEYEAVAEESKAATAALEKVKEELRSRSEQLEENVTTGRKAIGRAKEALTKVEARLQQLVDAEDTRAQSIAAEIQVAKSATTAANARLAEASGPDPELADCTEEPAAGCSSAVSEASSLCAAAEAAKLQAESRLAKAAARLADVKSKRSASLATLAEHGGTIGDLGRRIVELEGELELLGAAKKVQDEVVPKVEPAETSLANNQEPSAAGGNKEEPSADSEEPSAAKRTPARLVCLAPSDSDDLGGEYRLLPHVVCARPAYTRRGPSTGKAVFLFWSPARGRCAWVLASQPPAASDDPGATAVAAAGASEGPEVPGIIARSLQTAWAALPDELHSKRWDKGGSIVDLMFFDAPGA